MQSKGVIAEETITISLQEYEQLLSLQDQLAELKRLVFGRKSERFIPSDSAQSSLFDQDSDDPSSAEAPAEVQSVSYEREVRPKEKQQPVRALLPAHLPREEEVIEPEGLEEGMKKIGEEVTEVLEHVPGRLYVRRIVRPKYVKGQEEGVQIGLLPSLPIPKGNAGPGLLAHIQVSKWVDHLPYYRQVQIFKREGVKLAESTINGWFNATCTLLQPLYEKLVDQVKHQSYLQADESPIKVQDNHKQGTTHIGYHWVYHAPVNKLAVFDYQPSRSREGPSAFLKGFQGRLQTDGYAAYNELGRPGKGRPGRGRPGKDITLLACMAHARRYFEKALDNERGLAHEALAFIQSLYAVERTAKEEGLNSTERQKLREQQALPILKKWKQWLDNQQQTVLPKSPFGKAVNYTLGLWPRLVRYIEDGNVEIDNNKIENVIRPLALGRKNYLFAGSHPAAQRAAMMYSFFATCKLNKVEPYQWLKYVLENIQDTKINRLDKLLPTAYKSSLPNDRQV